MRLEDITVEVASEEHLVYVGEILEAIENAAKVRGTGIARRKPEYLAQKIKEAKAVIALYEGRFSCGKLLRGETLGGVLFFRKRLFRAG